MIVARLIVAGLLFLCTGLTYQGWRQRNEPLPVTHMRDLGNHHGEIVRIRGVIRSAEQTDLPIALQTIYNPPPRGSSTSNRRTVTRVRIWPSAVIVSDGEQEVRVATYGIDRRFIKRADVLYTIGGEHHGTRTPMDTTGTLQVEAIRAGDTVAVVGVVNESDVGLIQGGTQSVIISNLPDARFEALYKQAGGLKIALGVAAFIFVLGAFLWFRAGARRTIRGVAIYPLEIEAGRTAVSKADLYRKLDVLLQEHGIEPSEYQQRRRRAKMAGCLILLLPPILGIVLAIKLAL